MENDESDQPDIISSDEFYRIIKENSDRRKQRMILAIQNNAGWHPDVTCEELENYGEELEKQGEQHDVE